MEIANINETQLLIEGKAGRRPPDQNLIQKAIELYDSGKIYKEIADEMNVPEGTILRWIFPYHKDRQRRNNEYLTNSCSFHT